MRGKESQDQHNVKPKQQSHKYLQEEHSTGTKCILLIRAWCLKGRKEVSLPRAVGKRDVCGCNGASGMCADVTEEGRKCLGTLSGRLDGWWTGCEVSGKTKDSQILTAGGRDCHLLT